MKHKSLSLTTVQIMIAKADYCLQIAGAQHEAASKQHLNADKLHELARGLKAEAAEIAHSVDVSVDPAGVV